MTIHSYLHSNLYIPQNIQRMYLWIRLQGGQEIITLFSAALLVSSWVADISSLVKSLRISNRFGVENSELYRVHSSSPSQSEATSKETCRISGWTIFVPHSLTISGGSWAWSPPTPGDVLLSCGFTLAAAFKGEDDAMAARRRLFRSCTEPSSWLLLTRGWKEGGGGLLTSGPSVIALLGIFASATA